MNFMAGSAGLLLVCAFGAAQEQALQTRRVPADSLPTPLLRELLLGAEELAAGWDASDEQVALGRRLFFDPRLSEDHSIACASCHQPQFAFADDRALSLGIHDQAATRNTPSLLNKSLSSDVLWDGRAATIEDQVLMPIANPREMGLEVEQAVARLLAEPTYVAQFESAFESAPDEVLLAKALAAFVRALAVGNSPVDRFRAGETTALTPEERAGMWIYEGRAGCWRCHVGPNFSDEEFHNTGVGSTDGVPQAGRGAITNDAADLGKFRTPGLRMLTKTGPYMHDGSLATLEEVVEFYREGGKANSNLSDEIGALDLSDEDVQHLVAFLKALSR